MSLRKQAALDHQNITENKCEFGWSVFLIDPEKRKEELVGLTNDISLIIDPETGEAVSGSLITFHCSQFSIFEAGFKKLPYGVSDTNKKPWLVEFEDLNGKLTTFKISSSNPDNTLNAIKFNLELYEVQNCDC